MPAAARLLWWLWRCEEGGDFFRVGRHFQVAIGGAAMTIS
jgi:hypothetical protein